MNRQQGLKFLKCLKVDVHNIPITKGWFQFRCVFAPWKHEWGEDKNPSMGIYLNPNGKSRFNCFACNWAGDAHDIILELHHKCKGQHDMDIKTAMSIVENEEDGAGVAFGSENTLDWDEPVKPFYEFPEWFLEKYPSVTGIKEAEIYLKMRHTPRTVWADFDLRWDASERRVCFPVRNYEGVLGGFHGRCIDKNPELAYRMYTFMEENNPMLWLGEHMVTPDKTIIVCESVFDMTRIYQVYQNVMCALTASIKFHKIDRLKYFDDFIHIWDADKAGKQACSKVRKQYPNARHRIINLDKGKDPGDLDVFELQDILENFVQIDNLILD